MIHGRPRLRRLLWSLAICGLLFAGTIGLLTWQASKPRPPSASASASAQNSQETQNLAVFDAVWDTLDRHFYDRTFGGVDVTALRREYRPLAQQAGSTAALYLEVLNPMLNRLGGSHLEAAMPSGETLPSGVSFRLPEPRRGQNPWPFSPQDQTGHGMTIAWDGHATVVDTVRAGSPADREGIEPGSRIRLLSLRGAPRDQPEGEISGRFLVQSGNVPAREIAMTWQRQPPPAAREAHRLADGVTLVRFDAFTPEDMDWVLAQIASASPAGLIIDLRRNTGGSVAQLSRLMAAVLPAGTTTTVLVEGSQRRALRTPSQGQPYSGPVAVLIGPRTSSAAEGFTSAIQHHHRGAVIGQRSAGALLYSLFFPLPDGGRLTVPVRDVLTPDGDRIEGIGVTPDVEVRETLAAVRTGHDLVVATAQRALRLGSTDDASPQ